MNEKGLTEREELFCRRFAECYNATQAALDVGYGRRKDGTENRKSAENAGYKLRKKPEVRERIAQLMSDCANEAGATPIYIAQKLKEITDRCLQEVKPEMVWNGAERKLVESGEYVFNARDAVNALKVLADIQGLAKETKRIEGGLEVTLPEEVAQYGQ